MFLYNLTLQRATGITCAVHGNFSGSKLQEIIVSRGKILELLRHDPNTGKIYPVLSVEVFGMIRSLMPFRLTGGSKGDFFKLAILTSQVLICWLTIYVNLLNTFGNSHVVHSRLCCGWIRFWKDCHSWVYCTKEHIWKGLFLRKFLKRTWVCLDIHRLFLATWNTHSDVYMYLH